MRTSAYKPRISNVTGELGETFGPWLERQRKSGTMTQKALADTLGVSDTFISNIEQDKRRPSPQLVAQIARLFNQDVNALLILAGYEPITHTDTTTPLALRIIRLVSGLSPERQELAVRLLETMADVEAEHSNQIDTRLSPTEAKRGARARPAKT
ncbi:MAG: helix-turn-helix domain-containing protein [Chloroflexi bacterium]|nr:helix-turn-helix domain-containing protein [Chloroflexota bacterium]